MHPLDTIPLFDVKIPLTPAIAVAIPPGTGCPRHDPRPAAPPSPRPGAHATVADAYGTVLNCGNIEENLFELKMTSLDAHCF
jgi:hypothetical protein